MFVTALPTVSTNGNGILEPRSQDEAQRILTAGPMSVGYVPSLPVTAFWDRGGNQTLHIWGDIERMLLHPHCILPYNYYKSGMAHCEFKVRANSPEVKQFNEEMIRRFWERSCDTLQLSYDYGWGGYEVGYAMQAGMLCFETMWDFSPLDVWMLTSKNHHYRGIAVNSGIQGGKLRLWGPRHWPAKAFWHSHHRRWNRYYGRSQLYGAWRPWRRLAYRDGAEEVVDGAWYRLGYRGPTIRFPPRSFPKRGGGPGELDWEGARNKAREFAENAKAGASVALPNSRDDKGEYEWQIEWDNQTIRLDGLLELVKSLQGEISYGVEVPPELIEAAETGSGWSGRKIPLLGFYVGQLRNARAGVWAYKTQIGDPLTRWNFGSAAKYDIDVVLKIPDELAGGGEQQGMEQAAGQGPPDSAGPGQPQPAPALGGQQPPGPGVQLSTVPRSQYLDMLRTSTRAAVNRQVLAMFAESSRAG